MNELKGHQDIAVRLSAAIARGAVARAYLFHGPEGIGKFAAAKAFAAAVNCADGPACSGCPTCSRIDSGSHPDVHIIDEGYDAEIKIESIRQLQQEIALRPYEANHKVFIVNDSHNLNAVSANALLKTLEETPDKSIIILVTDKPRSMPGTIISRCRRVNFRPLSRGEFSAALAEQGFEEAVRDYLGYFCEGRLGFALRLKGQGLLQEKNSLIDGFLSGRIDESMKREELRRALTVMAGWFRDVYVAKLGAGTVINADRKDDVAAYARKYGFDDLERIFEGISSGFLFLEQNVNSKLLLANLQACLKI